MQLSTLLLWIVGTAAIIHIILLSKGQFSTVPERKTTQLSQVSTISAVIASREVAHFSLSDNAVGKMINLTAFSHSTTERIPQPIHENSNCIQIKAGLVICHPTYFIIGVAKAGTSSLGQYMNLEKHFLERIDKETWHTHVPFAQEYHVSGTDAPMKIRHKYDTYLRSYRFKGIFNCTEEKGCTHQNLDQRTFVNRLAAVYLKHNITVPQHVLSLQRADASPKYGVGRNKSIFMTGDAVPDLHYYADVPKSIQAHYPEAKIILGVRDNLDRAISTFRFCYLGMEGEPSNSKAEDLRVFLKVLDDHKAEMDRCEQWNESMPLPDTSSHWELHPESAEDKKKLAKTRGIDHPVHKNYVALRKQVAKVANPCHFQPFLNNHNNIWGRARSHSHVKWWLQFYKPENILVIDYKLFIGQTRRVVDETLRFLGIDGGAQYYDVDSVFALTLRGPDPRNSIAESVHGTVGSVKENATRDELLREIRDPTGVGAQILTHRGLWRFHPDTMNARMIDEISKHFKDYDYREDLQKIAELGVNILR